MFHTTAPRTATDATALDHDGSAESAAEGARLAVLNAAAATAAADATGAIIGASGSSGGSLLATTYHQALDSRTDVDLERERELQDGDGVFEAAANKRNDKNPFRLSANFLERYKDVKPPFGFNGLGELVYVHHGGRSIEIESASWRGCWLTHFPSLLLAAWIHTYSLTHSGTSARTLDARRMAPRSSGERRWSAL